LPNNLDQDRRHPAGGHALVQYKHAAATVDRVFEGDYVFNDDKMEDIRRRFALHSGPALSHVEGFHCNECNIPQEPYVILGNYTFHDTPKVLLDAASYGETPSRLVKFARRADLD
jgi:hypothetical protein